MKGIYWRTLTFKKSVIYLIKVNYTSYNYTPCNSTWTCLKPKSFLVKYTQLWSYEKYLVDIPHTKVIDAKCYSK